MRNPVPRHVKIGAIRFAVMTHRRVLRGNSWGAMHYSKAVIKLKSGISPQHQACTLLHEIVHATLSSLGRDDLSSDEDFVEEFSISLIDTLRNSNGLLRYFSKL